MMKLMVCVGSACHLKGAHKIVDIFSEIISEMSLDLQIELAAGFCLGHCTEAVTCKAGDEYILNVTPENARDKFMSVVLPLLETGRGSA